MLRSTVVAVTTILVILALSPPAAASSPAWYSRPGTAAHALSLPDLSPVTLDCMWVDRVIGNYAFVRDPWPGWTLLPVYTDAQLRRYETVEVQGYTRTVGGTRIVVARQVRLYLDSRGGGMPLFPPKGRLEPEEWPFMWEVPTTPVPPDASVPAPPDPNSAVEPAAPAVPPVGSIAEAKRGASAAEAMAVRSSGFSSAALHAVQWTEGTVQLQDKVVTAVFHSPDTHVVTSFYIQEPTTAGNGIKVVPQMPVPVEPGNIMTVRGQVIASSSSLAECYVSASSVECTGSTTLPKPIGMPTRATAGAAFGCQQLLWLQTEDQSANPPRYGLPGAGLSVVGTRVRVSGRVTYVSAGSTQTVYCIDDGSALKSELSGDVRTGIRVIMHGSQTTTYGVGDYAEGITGVLGAEMSEDPTPQPVPVVRVMRERVNPSHIWYVRPSPAGSDSNTGFDWAHALATPQAAINKSWAGDEIWVAAGTYTQNITLTDDVPVYGGFTGTETLREQRNWQTNVSIIDGDHSGRVVAALCGTVRIDGFTIQNGSATYGAGIYCYYASITAANNVIRDNSATYGGGVYCDGTGVFTIASNYLTSNSATGRGAGMYLFIYGSGTSAVVTENTVTGNSAPYGGGLYELVSNYGSASIAGNTFSLNTASHDGAGIYSSTSSSCSVSVSGNSIYSNTADIWGGGVCSSGMSQSQSVAGNAISGNSASFGGGIALYNGILTLSSNTLDSNTAASGGGVYCMGGGLTAWNNIFSTNSVACYGDGVGGAVYADGSSGGTLSGNTFSGNYADSSGGAVRASSNMSISGNSFSANYARLSGGAVSVGVSSSTAQPISGNTFFQNHAYNGGAVDLAGSGPILANTFSGNYSDFSGGALYVKWPAALLISANTFSGNHADTGYGGAMVVWNAGGGSIVNNLFVDNVAAGFIEQGGGAVYIDGSTMSVVNNTFHHNRCEDSDPTAYGGAVHVNGYPSWVTFVNNIFDYNEAQWGNSVACSYGAGAQLSYCDAYPGGRDENYWPSAWTLGSGCLYADPAFCGSAPYYYRLQSGSPVRGAGLNPASGSPVPTVDKDGRPRPGSNYTTDMGAYEDAACQ